MAERIVLMITHGAEHPERATIPFVLATAAQASEVEVLIGLQINGVLLARKGVAETIQAEAFPPLKELVDIYLENGGQLFVCGPCVKSRGIHPENDMLPGAKVVNAATFVKEISEATNVMVY